ncbi:hypothetical protein EB118_08785 [bacterium]|nr:hypothetical protein [bacterium]NDC94664.1 hypothetical protein [bacterium]NDD84307.1 hypothetical protein [bacterium]NDG30158.1 hypothetical protein [bacterium]
MAVCQHITQSGTPCKYVSKTVYDGKHLCKRHLDVVKSVEDCALCLCDMGQRKNKIRLHCGHYFHLTCLSHVQKAECPLCRSVMSAQECILVFDKTVIKPVLTEVFSTNLSTQDAIWNIIKSLIKMSKYTFDPSYYISCISYICNVIETTYIPPTHMNSILVLMSNAVAYVRNTGSLDGFQANF